MESIREALKQVLEDHNPNILIEYVEPLGVYQVQAFVEVEDKRLRFDLELTGGESIRELEKMCLKLALEAVIREISA